MYRDTLLKLFCEYMKAKRDYETLFISLIEGVDKAQDDMSEISHPYSYADFLRFQEITKNINDKWLELSIVQKKLLDCMSMSNQ